MIIENEMFYGVLLRADSPKEAFKTLKATDPFFAPITTYLIDQEDKVGERDVLKHLTSEKPVLHEKKCKVYFLGDNTFYFFRNKAHVSPIKIYEEAENIISRWKRGDLDSDAIEQLEKAIRGSNE